MQYVFWGIAAAVLAGYVGLFCVRRHVSLRPPRVGWIMCTTAVVRFGLLVFGLSFATTVELIATFALLGCGVGLLFIRRAYLLRVDAATLKEQVETACRGLFLQCEEQSSGVFQLTAKGTTKVLRTRAITHALQWVTLPALHEKSKISLLIQWLSKQYPGPVPRIHIVLKKE